MKRIIKVVTHYEVSKFWR